MPKKATGLPRGRPPVGGHPPDVVAAARASHPSHDPKAIFAMWDAEQPKHARSASAGPELVRMTHPAGVELSHPRAKRFRDDPVGVYVREGDIGDLTAHGFRIDHGAPAHG
jgi:hypothetical protein